MELCINSSFNYMAHLDRSNYGLDKKPGYTTYEIILSIGKTSFTYRASFSSGVVEEAMFLKEWFNLMVHLKHDFQKVPYNERKSNRLKEIPSFLRKLNHVYGEKQATYKVGSDTYYANPISSSTINLFTQEGEDDLLCYELNWSEQNNSFHTEDNCKFSNDEKYENSIAFCGSILYQMRKVTYEEFLSNPFFGTDLFDQIVSGSNVEQL